MESKEWDSPTKQQVFTREEKLLEILNGFNLVNVLNRLILKYENIQYETKPFEIFSSLTSGFPYGLTSNGKYIYLCDFYDFSPGPIVVFNLKGERIPTVSSSSHLIYVPTAIDFYNNHLYIICEENITKCNLKLQYISSFTIPHSLYGYN